jgi:NADPH-dependent 2,4-dienoyl-CoA reductase/sulfur reductase-like enzyme
LNIVIIGNGVAGITCAQVARQRDDQARITVVSAETDYFFSRTALMYSYMDMMTRRDLEPIERSAYKKQRIDLVRDWVVDMDPDAGTVQLAGGESLPYDRLVFAVGAAPNMFPWKGADQIKDGKVHFVSMQDLDDCERLTKTSKQAVVVGGGLIGIELVECLLHHGVKVTFLIREPYYWPVALGREEADYVTEHMRHHGVDVRTEEEMTEIVVDEGGRVSGVVTNKGETLPCQMLGIAAGVKPNVERIKAFSHAPELGRGIKVDPTLQTNLPGVYACGDCAEIYYPGQDRPLSELIWYSAKRQGALVGRNLFGDGIRYEPPLFFNSSKFFEVEYTTVGAVMNAPDDSPTIYRKLPGKYVSQRIVHDGERVLGFNMLGSRWNHEVLERWVHERRSAEWVEKNLRAAQYDVEFGRAPLHKHDVKAMPLNKEWP